MTRDGQCRQLRSGIDGQQLSSIGTIIALEKGADSDEFFLTFEEIGGSQRFTDYPGRDSPDPTQSGQARS